MGPVKYRPALSVKHSLRLFKSQLCHCDFREVWFGYMIVKDLKRDFPQLYKALRDQWLLYGFKAGLNFSDEIKIILQDSPKVKFISVDKLLRSKRLKPKPILRINA